MHQIYLSTSICKPQLVNKCAMNMRVPLQLGNFGIEKTVSAFLQSSIWYNKEKNTYVVCCAATNVIHVSTYVEKRKHANDTFNITQHISGLYKEIFHYESP